MKSYPCYLPAGVGAPAAALLLASGVPDQTTNAKRPRAEPDKVN